MLSLNDIKHKRFQKASLNGGYKREEVDDFLDEVEASYAALIQKTAEQHDETGKKAAELKQVQQKVKVLEEQIETFHQEENEIKDALISAQKMRDASVREARHQAEVILSDAKLKAKTIVETAQQSVDGQQQRLEDMKTAVSDFRGQMLEMYKKHIAFLTELPQHQAAAPVQQPAVEEPAAPEQQAPAADEPPVQSAAAPEHTSATFATTPDEPDYLTAKPFEPVHTDGETKPPVLYGEEYDLDDDDASEIFKRH